jgi:hypothetical protein
VAFAFYGRTCATGGSTGPCPGQRLADRGAPRSPAFRRSCRRRSAPRFEAMLQQVLDTGAVLTDDDFTAPDLQGLSATGSRRGTRRRTRTVSSSVWRCSSRTSRAAPGEAHLRLSHRRTERLQRATAALASALTLEDVAAVVSDVGRDPGGAVWRASRWSRAPSCASRARWSGSPRRCTGCPTANAHRPPRRCVQGQRSTSRGGQTSASVSRARARSAISARRARTRGQSFRCAD